MPIIIKCYFILHLFTLTEFIAGHFYLIPAGFIKKCFPHRLFILIKPLFIAGQSQLGGCLLI